MKSLIIRLWKKSQWIRAEHHEKKRITYRSIFFVFHFHWKKYKIIIMRFLLCMVQHEWVVFPLARWGKWVRSPLAQNWIFTCPWTNCFIYERIGNNKKDLSYLSIQGCSLYKMSENGKKKSPSKRMSYNVLFCQSIRQKYSVQYDNKQEKNRKSEELWEAEKCIFSFLPFLHET